MARRKAIDRTLAEMDRRIVRRFSVERVILLGSHARGDAGPDSDVDLLVIMHLAASSKRELRCAIRAELRGFGMPLQIVVTSQEEYAWRSKIPGTTERRAPLEGRLLHASS